MVTLRRRWLVGALLAAPVMGCAPAIRPAPIVGGEPGITTLLLVNHVASPLELQSLAITVDGSLVPLATLPPSSDDVVVLARTSSIPGEHALTLLAMAKAPAESADSVVVLRSSQGYRVGGGAAVVRIELVGAGGTARMVAHVSAEGAALEPPIDEATPDPTNERRCQLMLPIPRAICHAQTTLAIAGAAHDAVHAGCVHDKLVTMQSIAETLSAKPAADALRSAESRIHALSDDVDRCADGETTLLDDTATVVRIAR